jgi:hypothetical protein
MDLLDLIPIVPPTLPGERSPGLKPAQRFVARAASTALPVISFVLVLFVGFARHIAVALVALPLASAALTFLLSRRVATPIAWAIVIAAGCAAYCFVGSGFALLLHAFATVFQDLG